MPKPTGEILIPLNSDASKCVTIEQALRIALEHQAAGQPAQAEAICKQLIRKAPAHPFAPNLLGIMAHQAGRHDEAFAYYSKALSISPGFAAAHDNLGNLYLEKGNPDEAINCFIQAIKLSPDNASAHNNLGNLYHQQGKFDRALACYREALSLLPDAAVIHSNIGNIHKEYGQFEAAIEYYRKSLSLDPGYAEAYNNLGTILQDQDKHEIAQGNFEKAISLKPDYAEANYNLGYTFQHNGQHDRALACYQQALSLKPDYGEARWAITMARLSTIHGLHDTGSASRSRFIDDLDELDAWFTQDRLLQGHRSVGSRQPFFLAYQEENNRDLLSRYGRICTRLMKAWMEHENFSPPGNIKGKTIRIGIVSAHIRDHSVWHALVKGWLRHLSRTHFELYVFHIGSRQDDETAWAQAQSAFFAQGVRRLRQWVELITENQLDILFYPEVGMDPMTARLASLRLAPVQVATWGHPETTGLPTMDYYMSAKDLEPPDAKENYTERLVSLPNLGCCYHRLPVTASEAGLEHLDIDWQAPLILCPGVPFKYAPQHDHVFPEIARRVGRCQFIFFAYGGSNLSARLQQRLEQVFRQAGLNPSDYITFIPWLPKALFYGLMKRADVFMDTIGFSGFNTAIQAIECSLPMVIREGRFMRGRLASGILRRMALTELIADSEETYVEMVARLVLDTHYRQLLRQRIEENRHVLFDDLAPVHALEEFLISVVNKH